MKLLIATISSLVLFAGPALSQSPAKARRGNTARIAARSLARLVANGGGPLIKGEFESSKLPSGLANWLSRHSTAIVDAGPDPFPPSPLEWGVATTSGNKLFLHILKWPADDKLSIPRLHNSVKSVRLIGKTDDLKLMPNVKDWEITLPDKPARRDSLLPILEVELDSAAVVGGTTPPVVAPSADGTISLHSRFAIVHGEMLRFEPQPHKNTIGYWVKEADWAEWTCIAPASRKYHVELRYGCGDGQGGSDLELTIGDAVLPFRVQSTGGFQAWREVQLGTVELTTGKTIRVTAKPKKKAKTAVMDIQQITLRPI